MLLFRRAGMAVAEHLATLRVDPGHHVLDDPVFSSRIHRLENQQDGVGVGCVKKGIYILKSLSRRAYGPLAPTITDTSPNSSLKVWSICCPSKTNPNDWLKTDC